MNYLDKIIELIKNNLELPYKTFIEKFNIDSNILTKSMYSYYRIKFGKKTNKSVTPKNIIKYLKENKEKSFEELKSDVLEKFNFEINVYMYRQFTGKSVTVRKNFTKEQIEFLKENHLNRNLTDLFNKKFNTNYSKHSIQDKLSRLKICITKQTQIWLKENAPKYTYNELKHLFNKTFNTKLTRNEIMDKCNKLGLYCKKADKYAIYLDGNELNEETVVYVKPQIATCYSMNKLKSNDIELNKVRLKYAIIKDKLNELSHL